MDASGIAMTEQEKEQGQKWWGIVRQYWWALPLTIAIAIGLSIVLVYVVVSAILLGLDIINNAVSPELKFRYYSKIALGIAGILGIGLATWRGISSHNQSEAQLEQAKIASKTQAHNQYTQAVALLIKDDNKGKPVIEARLEGLWGLEFLVNASPNDYGVSVMKRIVAYIRFNAEKTARDMPSEPEKCEKPYPLGEDVKEAFVVLKRLYDQYRDDLALKPDDLSFAGAYFIYLDLQDIKWIDEVDLRHAKLQGAYLRDVRLQGADLRYAQLHGADFGSTQLQGADLRYAQLQGADFGGTQLQGADLQYAQLLGARLVTPKLQGADFRMAKLNYSQFHTVQIETNEELLKIMLSETDLRQDKIESIVERFNQNDDGRGLWKPLGEVSYIYYDGNFTPSRYDNPDIQTFDFKYGGIPWQSSWEGIFHDMRYTDVIDAESRYYIVQGLIKNFPFYPFLRNTCFVDGLVNAIKELPDYQEIYERLPKKYQKCLDNETP